MVAFLKLFFSFLMVFLRLTVIVLSGSSSHTIPLFLRASFKAWFPFSKWDNWSANFDGDFGIVKVFFCDLYASRFFLSLAALASGVSISNCFFFWDLHSALFSAFSFSSASVACRVLRSLACSLVCSSSCKSYSHDRRGRGRTYISSSSCKSYELLFQLQELLSLPARARSHLHQLHDSR